MANESIRAAFERFWQHTIAKINTKADIDHTHDVVNNATHATTADTAASATTANSATKATQDGAGNVINNTYETKTDATSKLNSAKAYTDSEIAEWVGDTTVPTQISNAVSQKSAVQIITWESND